MIRILVGHVLDRLRELPDESVHCVVTSPPYWGLRDYGIEPQVWPDGWRGSLGLEPTPDLYVAHMVAVFRLVWRVLRKDGTLWLNLGDCYATGAGSYRNPGSDVKPLEHGGKQAFTKDYARAQPNRMPQDGLKPKDLLLMPARVALALQADGWWLRSEIVWAKRAPMPESVTDRPTSAHEKVFLLARSAKYYFDTEAVKEEALPDNDRNNRYGDGFQRGPGYHNTKRNLRNVWHLGPEPFPEAHFATFVTEIPRRAILAGTSERGVCPTCGVPWARVMEQTGSWRDGAETSTQTYGHGSGNRRARSSNGGMSQSQYQQIGWQPTCDCDVGEPVPATVLDPFLGSGTTTLVSDQLRRHAIGIELNPEYAAMARRRTVADAPLLAEVAD